MERSDDRPHPSLDEAFALRLRTPRRVGRRALRAVLGVAVVSVTLLDLLLADVKQNPEKVAPLIEALGLNLPTEEPPRLGDADEAAARLGLSPRTITRAASAGRVEGAVRVGRGWRFRLDVLALAPPEGSKPLPAPLRPRPQRHAGNGAADAIRGHQPTNRRTRA